MEMWRDAPVAQRIEQPPSKRLVAGSIPAGRALDRVRKLWLLPCIGPPIVSDATAAEGGRRA
jgi:hypothetical protein